MTALMAATRTCESNNGNFGARAFEETPPAALHAVTSTLIRAHLLSQLHALDESGRGVLHYAAAGGSALLLSKIVPKVRQRLSDEQRTEGIAKLTKIAALARAHTSESGSANTTSMPPLSPLSAADSSISQAESMRLHSEVQWISRLIFSKDVFGRRPVDMAICRGQRSCADYLIARERETIDEMLLTPPLEGWLYKLGEKGLVKTYKKRWFVRRGEKIFYYKEPQLGSESHIESVAVDAQALGFIPLNLFRASHSDRVVKDIKQEAGFGGDRPPKEAVAFEINTPSRLFTLLAPNESEAQRWIDTLERIREEAEQGMDHQGAIMGAAGGGPSRDLGQGQGQGQGQGGAANNNNNNNNKDPALPFAATAQQTAFGSARVAVMEESVKEPGWKSLHTAVLAGDLGQVQAVLDRHAGEDPPFIECASEGGQWRPVHLAALACGSNSSSDSSSDSNSSDATAILSLLLERGGDPLATSAFRETPLHVASAAPSPGGEAAIRVLLAHFAQLDGGGGGAMVAGALAAVDARGCTPLHAAIESGRLNAVRVLVAAQAQVPLELMPDPDLAGFDGGAGHNISPLEILSPMPKAALPPLVSAAHLGNAAILQCLLSSSSSSSSSSSETGSQSQSQSPSRLASDVNRCTLLGMTPLLFAAQGGFRAACEALLASGADPSQQARDGATAAHYAAAAADADLLRSLLEAGVAPDAKTVTVAAHAQQQIRRGMRGGGGGGADGPGVTDRLALSHEIGVLVGGSRTPLHVAAVVGSAPCVLELLRYGANPNAFTETERETPLLLAAREGHATALAQLLAGTGLARSDPSIGDRTGATPLIAVCGRVDQVCAETLLASAAVSGDNHDNPAPWVNQANGRGETALIVLAQQDVREPASRAAAQLAIAHRLLECGAGVNVRDARGRTALHYAVMRGSSQLSEGLVGRGADVEIRDTENNTPYMLSVREQQQAGLPHSGSAHASVNTTSSESDAVSQQRELNLYKARARPEKQGYLQKQSPAFHKKLQSRWFVLKEKTLYYFKSSENEEPLGTISMIGLQVQDKGKPLRFELLASNGHRYLLKAVDEEDKAEWVQVLLGAVSDR
jgi:ankyrin repeat protein